MSYYLITRDQEQRSNFVGFVALILKDEIMGDEVHLASVNIQN